MTSYHVETSSILSILTIIFNKLKTTAGEFIFVQLEALVDNTRPNLEYHIKLHAEKKIF